MQIDVSGVPFTLGKFTSEGIEPDEGEAKKLKVDVSVTFNAAPDFLDRYLDGHNTGAQPSDVFWRTDPTDKKDTSKYVRYLGIDKIVLAVPGTHSLFMLRLEPRRKPEDPDLLPNVTLANCQLKSLQVELAANAVLAHAKLVAYPPDKGTITALAAIAAFDDLVGSLTANDRDLFSETKPAEPPPRPGSDAYDRAEPEPVKGPNEVVQGWGDVE
jgi:hypothetical protein